MKYVPVERAEECSVHLLGHFIALGSALVSLRNRLLTKYILASPETTKESFPWRKIIIEASGSVSLERSHNVFLMAECRRAYDCRVDFAIFVDLGHVVRVHEGGVSEIPLCPRALPDA